ncbi:MAG: GGDEF domain-containing protein [Microbacteriaceae bacterium]|nr:GGDEF domain-containing protein [Burkholderiaceae bacterium]
MGVLLAAVGTAASYFQLTRFLREDLTRSVSAQQLALAGYVAGDVDGYLMDRQRFLERLAPIVPQELLAQPALMQRWLAEHHALYPLFSQGLAIADAQGRMLGDAATLVAQRPEVAGALAGRSTIGRPTAGPVPQHALLPIATPVLGKTGQVTAVLIGTTDLSKDGLLDHLQRARVGHSGGILVVSPRDGLFVASTDTAMSLTPTPPAGVNVLHDRAMAGFRGSGVTVNAIGVEEISAIAAVPASGWFVVARLPVAEALGTVGRMQSFILRRRLLGVLVGLVLLGFIVAWLLRPLLRAAAEAEKMTRGEIPLAPLRVVRDDEIGHLTGAFNRLLSKLGEKQAELERLAYHDSLTDLPNRKLFADRLRQALARTQRRAHRVGLLYLDLDGFKRINDTLGHEAGDEALQEIARRLLGVVRQTDTLARMGGDEFVLLAADLDAPAERAVRVLAQKCIDAVTQPLQLRGGDISVGVSIGIALTGNSDTPDSLLAAADKAMYEVKKNGRGSYRLAPVTQ